MNNRLAKEMENVCVIPEFKLTCSMKQKQSELFTVKRSVDAVDYLRSCYETGTLSVKEYFYTLFLNKANRITGFMKVSEGGMTGTVADPRIILQAALIAGATSLVLCHNHPSGNLRPSRQDEELTMKIKHAAQYFDIVILDHVILNEESFYSFADEGIL